MLKWKQLTILPVILRLNNFLKLRIRLEYPVVYRYHKLPKPGISTNLLAIFLRKTMPMLEKSWGNMADTTPEALRECQALHTGDVMLLERNALWTVGNFYSYSQDRKSNFHSQIILSKRYITLQEISYFLTIYKVETESWENSVAEVLLPVRTSIKNLLPVFTTWLYSSRNRYWTARLASDWVPSENVQGKRKVLFPRTIVRFRIPPWTLAPADTVQAL